MPENQILQEYLSLKEQLLTIIQENNQSIAVINLLKERNIAIYLNRDSWQEKHNQDGWTIPFSDFESHEHELHTVLQIIASLFDEDYLDLDMESVNEHSKTIKQTRDVMLAQSAYIAANQESLSSILFRYMNEVLNYKIE